MFLAQISEFRTDWVLPIKSRHFRNFLEISQVFKILSLKLYGNLWGNSYINFHFWWKQTVLKSEKVRKCFVEDCLKIFFLVFASSKMY